MADELREAAAALRAVLDGVREAPDTTADPVHTAYLAGVADGLDLAGAREEQGDTPVAIKDVPDQPDTV